MSGAASTLRALLRGDGMLVAPGAYDCITARCVERAGFSAVYMSGAGTAASAGFPDYGLLAMDEVAENAARIADAVSIPVIADGDTGFGNVLNVVRTVRAFAKAGVGGIHLEDQTFPKRCGHLEGKEVVAREEFLQKIRAAVDTRRDPAFVVIARTDARAIIGFDEAITRASLALDCGADLAFVEAPESIDEVRAVPRLVNGPCVLNVVHLGRTPPITLEEAEQWGYRLAIVPGIAKAAATAAVEIAMERLRDTGRYPASPGDADVVEGFRKAGADDWDAIRRRYATPASDEQDAPAEGCADVPVSSIE